MKFKSKYKWRNRECHFLVLNRQKDLCKQMEGSILTPFLSFVAGQSQEKATTKGFRYYL